MQKLSLHLDVLPPSQRRLWEELSQVPKEFVLYGGTALALRLGSIAPTRKNSLCALAGK